MKCFNSTIICRIPALIVLQCIVVILESQNYTQTTDLCCDLVIIDQLKFIVQFQVLNSTCCSFDKIICYYYELKSKFFPGGAATAAAHEAHQAHRAWRAFRVSQSLFYNG